MIILSTDTEIDKDYYRALKTRLSGAGSLIFDPQRELTIFQEGYFWENQTMADRLYTSNEADEVLSALRFETKLEKATLARMVFALSLVKEGPDVAQVPVSPARR